MSRYVTGTVANPSRRAGKQTLVATDDCLIFPSCQNGLDEAELPQAPFERVEFLLADASRVGRIGTQLIDWTCSTVSAELRVTLHAMRSATPSERSVSSPSGCASSATP